jgi:hypothetical protein
MLMKGTHLFFLWMKNMIRHYKTKTFFTAWFFFWKAARLESGFTRNGIKKRFIKQNKNQVNSSVSVSQCKKVLSPSSRFVLLFGRNNGFN